MHAFNLNVKSRYIVILLFIVVIITTFILFYKKNNFTKTNESFDSTNLFYEPLVSYAIVFDAGSTGTRVHAFKFISGGSEGLILDDSLFKTTKPGLSSFANDPSKVSPSITPLIESVLKFIPSTFHFSTPITLKATAGLRVLSPEISKNLLFQVRNVFHSYPFRFSENDVSIMNGSDEGLFSWFSVNFLHGVFGNNKKINTSRSTNNTWGVLDLGGGSTQITFQPFTLNLNSIPPDHLIQVRFFGKEFQLYTNSYLGLGMMAARFKIMGGDENKKGDLIAKNLTSPCLPSNLSSLWTYRGIDHSLLSLEVPSNQRFFQCKQSMMHLFNPITNLSRSLSTSPLFYAISFFFDRLVQEGIIKNKHLGQNVRVSLFERLAQTSCMNPRETFQCLDLTYMHLLFTKGYGFHDSQLLTVQHEINKYEISWPLGAAFQLLQKLIIKA